MPQRKKEKIGYKYTKDNQKFKTCVLKCITEVYGLNFVLKAMSNNKREKINFSLIDSMCTISSYIHTNF